MPRKAQVSGENEAQEKRLLLCRPSNNVKMGLVGLPNVGKSSLFNLLSGLNVPAENFPYCTIDPANATIPVPDKRFKALCNAWKPKSKVPAVLQVTDIAGLMAGASTGEGLGNEFLSNIQAVDGIYHVTREFKDRDIEHVIGEINPIRDFEVIRSELAAKDLKTCQRQVEDLSKKLRGKKDKAIQADLECAQKCCELLDSNKEIRFGVWTQKNIIYLNTLQLLTAKPCVFLVNMSKSNYENSRSAWMPKIKEWVAANAPGSPVIPFSVPFEQHLKDLADDAARKAFLATVKAPSMMNRIIRTGYHSMNLIHFFTTGPKEVRAWTIKNGWKAPQAAGAIHGDLEQGFICADTYNFKDFKEHGDEKAVQAAGKSRTQGKDYVVKDGDIIFFKANGQRGGKRG